MRFLLTTVIKCSLFFLSVPSKQKKKYYFIYLSSVINPFKCLVQRLKPSFQTTDSLHFPLPIPSSCIKQYQWCSYHKNRPPLFHVAPAKWSLYDTLIWIDLKFVINHACRQVFTYVVIWFSNVSCFLPFHYLLSLISWISYIILAGQVAKVKIPQCKTVKILLLTPLNNPCFVLPFFFQASICYRLPWKGPFNTVYQLLNRSSYSYERQKKSNFPS